MTTVSVHDVVAFLLAKASSHLSMAAIHRMTYYSQGWHLAWNGNSLFDEDLRIRKSGPVAPALFALQKDGCTQESWPAGNAAAITGPSAAVLDTVFNSYGHMTGISLGQSAHKEAPCRSAWSRRTGADPEPVIDLTEMKSFFKALGDAPEDGVAYANRFMDRYTDVSEAETEEVHTLAGPSFASAILPETSYSGWYWKCSCGTQVSWFIGNWPKSEDEARAEWKLHLTSVS